MSVAKPFSIHILSPPAGAIVVSKARCALASKNGVLDKRHPATVPSTQTRAGAPSQRRHGRGGAQGLRPAPRAAGARQGDAAVPGGAQLRDAHAGHHGRAAPQPPLLQQGRAPEVAVRVARDRRLAAAAAPRGGLLPQPARARPQRAGGAHPAEDTPGRRGARAGDRCRRLPVRVRAVVRARVHLGDPHLHAAGLHRLLRVPDRAAAADGAVGERGGAADRGRRGAGAARLLGPPRRGDQGAVLAGVPADPRRGGAVRAGAAADRADLQAGRGRRARGDVRAGDGDAAGDGLLRHRFLHRRHDRQQRLPGDLKGSAGVPAGGGPVLHGAGVERHPVAVLLPGRRGRHLLRAHPVRRDPHRGLHPGHGGAGRHLPA
ncbi:hypothetical protein ACQJBY_044336 [Aegilops geniculata]